MKQQIEEFLNNPSLRANTRSFYGSVLNNSFSKIFSDISQIDLKKYAAALEHDGLSGKSIQQYLTVAKSFMRAVGLVPDYTYRIRADEKRQHTLDRAERWFDRDDIVRCISYRFSNADTTNKRLRNRCIVRLLVETGVRVDELACMHHADFSVSEGYVMVCQTKTQPRPVFFSPDTGKLVEKYMNNTPETAGLFPTTSQIRRIVCEMLDALNLKKQGDGRGPHTFRHYIATHMVYVWDMSLEDVARILGDKPETIRAEYLHPSAAMLRRRIDQATAGMESWI